MFCDEPVIRVYLCQDESITKENPDANSYFDFIIRLAYHVTEGYYILLETESYMISIGVDGVTKITKAVFVQKESVWMRPGIEYEDGERFVSALSTLFCGERLLRVQKAEGNYVASFDDFSLLVVPYSPKGLPWNIDRHDSGCAPLLGFDRHLIRKCECGGEGQVLLDHVNDYVVRCKRCHKSTWANMVLQDAIDDWNSGDTPCEVDVFEDNASEFWSGQINYFAVSNRGIYPISAQSCDFEEAIASVGDRLISIQHRHINDEYGTFGFHFLTGYNESVYNMKVVATPEEPITFLEEVREPDGALSGIKFKCGGRYLFLYSLEYNLTLTKSMVDLEAELTIDELPHVDDSVLFNG